MTTLPYRARGLLLAEPPLVDLVNLFRSFGDNCEFGLVQREVGAEPIDLLRFAGLYIPTGHLAVLTDAITKGFEGLGQPGTVSCGLSDTGGHGGMSRRLLKFFERRCPP
jgi:hypothetical protein